MRIAIDASRANQLQRTGPASYAWHVIRELVRNRIQDSGFSLNLLAPEDPLPEWGTLPSNVSWKKLRWVGPGWTSMRLPLHLARAKYDVFFQPAASLCRMPSGTKSVVAIHDVSFVEAPDVYDPADLAAQRRGLDRARAADRIITISQHTRRLLVDRSGFDASKIVVTPLAADDGRAPVETQRLESMMGRYSIRSPYIITVSRIEKKKGIVEIVQALAQLSPDVQLVLCGRDGFGADQVRRKIVELKLDSRVKFLGWVPDADLACLLSGATAYVSACRYEGFGIAVLDALACGCPVVAYNAGAVPETVGNAAVLVDPSGPEHLANGIRQVLDSTDTYHRLAKLGVERAREFSWKRTAEQTYSLG